MFRPMRRKRQELSTPEAVEVLKRGKTGILGLIGDDGYPYTVPLNYVYVDGKIYVHGAKSGHKYDAVRNCDKASFCVVDRDDIISEKLTTAYRSAIAFGRIRILEDEQEIREAARILGLKYCSNTEFVEHEIQREWALLACFELKIEHLSGKVGKELLKAADPS